MRRRHFTRAAETVVAGSISVFSLAGCASYSPVPLPEKVDLADRIPLQITQPLDMNAVATVAVLNNPDLRTARRKGKIGEAQAFAAGILPNPQLTTELVTPTNQGSVGGNGFAFGLAYDLQALI